MCQTLYPGEWIFSRRPQSGDKKAFHSKCNCPFPHADASLVWNIKQKPKRDFEGTYEGTNE